MNNNNKIPTSLSDCYNSHGKLDVSKVFCLRRNQRAQALIEEEEEEQSSYLHLPRITETSRLEKESNLGKGSRASINLYRNEEGDLVPQKAENSNWYVSYIESPAINNPKFEKKFRRRFRCCYQSYLDLLQMVEVDASFSRWTRKDAYGRVPSPIPLLLLGCLRYLGRGWTFDDLEESTSISEEVHRVFFHVFIYWGSTFLYEQLVTHPITAGDELDFHCKEMNVCGLHGCIASTDATHVTMNRCPISRNNEHSGYKESLPSRTYNISVNHRRQILHSTRGHPARWNDKTIALFDNFIMDIKRGKILQDNVFFCLRKMNKEILYKKNIKDAGYCAIMVTRIGQP